MRFKIDPEFEKMIPPLTRDEFRQLEENILEEGRIHTPIIVWDDIIIDGHNRYKIAMAHPDIEYQIYKKEFDHRYEVIAWIYKNQLGRRNLTPQQKKYLVGRRYMMEKLIADFHGNQYTVQDDDGLDQIGPDHGKHGTRSRIAKETMTSDGYVQRAEYYAKGVDAAEEALPGIKEQLLSGMIKSNESDVAAIARAVPEERAAMAEKLRGPREKKNKPSSKATAEAWQIGQDMLHARGQMTADDLIFELRSSLEDFMFRWDLALKKNRQFLEDEAMRAQVTQRAQKVIDFFESVLDGSILKNPYV